VAFEKELITLTPEEYEEVKKVASNDALFKSTVLIEIKTLNKKADITNGTVKEHQIEIGKQAAKLNGNKVAHVFYNMFILGCITVTCLIVRYIFILGVRIACLVHVAPVVKTVVQ